jgi:hypothetical protein
MNMNPLAQFAPQGSGASDTPFGNMTSDQYKLMALQKELEEKTAAEMAKKSSSGKRNGALVKAIKSM